ncbi:MAG: glycosyltransferase family 2 protein [Deltaproteobacteria bacterium]|nr:glycosyltransferase family 2 protein [Deltaproteobacteria bacterium]
MPAYNEEGCIAEVVKRWLGEISLIPDAAVEMIVVNDGSRDSTGEILDSIAAHEPQLIVVHQKNGGHGTALLRAYREALQRNPDWVFHVDSDDQFLPQDFVKLWSRRGESQFIMGRRAVRHDAFHRLVITRILLLFNMLIFGAFLKDANVPYRLIKGSYLRKLLGVLPQDVFAPNIFLAVLARKDGQDLMEIPVGHRDRETGKVSIVRWRLIKACLRCVRELFLFRAGLSSSLHRLRQEP